MARFFIEEILPDPIESSEIRLDGDNAFHLVRVLRAKPGESVTVVAGDGREYRCEFVRSLDQNSALAAVLKVKEVAVSFEKPYSITLVQGIPKGKKTDLILQKATELGADRIAFVYMDRSIPTQEGSGEGKLSRFNRIVTEAASQSGRATIPEVMILSDLSEAISLLSECDIRFACYEAERHRNLPEVLRRQGKSIGFLIGPEGGLSPGEIDKLVKADIPTVSLGHRILRTETAPLAVLSMILYENELKN